ncbi:MAG: Tol-Pal system beta propeller repeat protein TolB [Deltaproteobacteria bacterium]|nr:Tol-Pal system beta propeller repeat protein TolB [Deltaproteobacteria bacterium]
MKHAKLGARARTRGLVAAHALAMIVAFVSLSLSASPAGAQIRGLVSGPGQTAFPIAIPRLEGPGLGSADSDRFGTILGRDLEISGLFRVVPQASAMTLTGAGAPEIDYAPWASMGARFVVGGRYERRGPDLVLAAWIYDVGEQRQLGGKRYEGPPGEAARMANRFADEVLRLITGERGPFDTEIAFISKREGGRFKELWVMRFDGGDLRQLTRNQSITLSPSWSPDGNSILYTSYADGRPRLYEMDVANRRSRRVLAGPGIVVGGRFSPNGREIAVAREEKRGNTDVVLIDRDGRTLGPIASDSSIDVSPTWSPDGSQIAFCSSRGGSPQIYVTGASGGPARRVTFQGSYNTSPVWSPRGDKIAYTGRVGRVFQIFVLDLASGSVTQVTRAGENVDPAWAPDGRYLVYSSSRSGRDELFVSDWRGLQSHRLIAGPGGDTSPAWSPWLGD